MANQAPPTGYNSVQPYLMVDGAAQLVDFLTEAFGAKERMRMAGPDGKIGHTEVEIGNSVIMLVRRGDSATASGGAAALYTYVGDVDRIAANARQAGAGVTDAEDTAWGDRVAVVTDPDGYRWVLATFKKLAPLS